MPVMNTSYKDLVRMVGHDVPMETMLEQIPLLGGVIDEHEEGSDAIAIEFFPNRPDMYSAEGIARGLKAFLGYEPGLKKYDIGKSDVKAIVTDEVKKIRPCFVGCVVKGVTIDDQALKSIMELQEKLHTTLGRKRSKLAIGVHDLDKVKAPFTFKAVDPDEMSFVPLTKTEAMTPREILQKHEKGKAYAHLLDGFDKYPMIFDADGNVLSFPPIINGALTTVTVNTKNIFIDVTGFDDKAVESALNIVASALVERGGQIYSIEMEGAPKKVYPDFTPQEKTISIAACNTVNGIPLTGEECIKALNRCGMDGKFEGDRLTAYIPAYRFDIMHDADIYEEVSIGYGFEKYGHKKMRVTQTFGSLLPETSFSENLKDIMIGLGYTELTTLTLSNQREEFEISGLPEVDVVTVKNPITEDHTCLRAYMMPSLMRILRHNKNRDLPQKIFEVGYVIRDAKNVLHLCALQAASRTSFTEIKSVTESVLREMNVEYTISSCDYSTFLPGRGAFIEVDGKRIGVFGEMSPKCITDFELTHPVMMMEMDISGIIAKQSGRLF
ncbi:MAG: phenylalanine--tRNA ligase subunit beta [Candidatus Methanomethylophilus sp.]|nr:phenylalanine--tRNA ligase subunit beta [Methanomethylophilus sp.]